MTETKPSNREVTFFFPGGGQMKFVQGQKSDHGIVEHIWYSKETHDAYIRVTTDSKTMIFKSIPYMVVEDKKEFKAPGYGTGYTPKKDWDQQ